MILWISANKGRERGEDVVLKKILTVREKEVFELLILGKTTKEIAKILKISEKTVRNHISHIADGNIRRKNKRSKW